MATNDRSEDRLTDKQAIALVMQKVAPPQGVNPNLFLRAVGNAVLANKHDGFISINDLPSQQEVQYAVALEEQRVQEDKMMMNVAADAAGATVISEATAAKTDDSTSLITEVADEMVRDFFNDFQFDLDRETIIGGFNDARFQLKDDAVFKDDLDADTLAVAAGANLAQRDKKGFRPGVNAAAKAMHGLSTDIKLGMRDAMKHGDFVSAATNLYDHSQELRDHYKKAREGAGHRGESKDELEKHFTEDTARMANRMHQRFINHARHEKALRMEPTPRAGRSQRIVQAQLAQKPQSSTPAAKPFSLAAVMSRARRPSSDNANA